MSATVAAALATGVANVESAVAIREAVTAAIAVVDVTAAADAPVRAFLVLL